MKLIVFTDGAARGNPGKSAVGVVIKDAHGVVQARLKRSIGTATNNSAEYTALLTALEFIIGSETLRCTELVVHTDSELMARQVRGEYKVKEPGLKMMREKVILLLKSAPFIFSIRHIPRADNAEADALANEALDSETR